MPKKEKKSKKKHKDKNEEQPPPEDESHHPENADALRQEFIFGENGEYDQYQHDPKGGPSTSHQDSPVGATTSTPSTSKRGLFGGRKKKQPKEDLESTTVSDPEAAVDVPTPIRKQIEEEKRRAGGQTVDEPEQFHFGEAGTVGGSPATIEVDETNSNQLLMTPPMEKKRSNKSGKKAEKKKKKKEQGPSDDIIPEPQPVPQEAGNIVMEMQPISTELTVPHDSGEWNRDQFHKQQLRGYDIYRIIEDEETIAKEHDEKQRRSLARPASMVTT